MQDLKRLVRIITGGTPAIFPLVDQSDDKSLEGKLYHIIKNSEALTDEEACQQLYGEQKVTPSYRMLKSRLRKKLLNSLLFTELTDNHIRSSRIKLVECLALHQQASKLFFLGEPILAEKIANHIIAIAEKAELNEMLAKAYELKQHADLLSHDRNKFEKNLELLQHYYYLQAKEQEALILFNKLKFELSINISNSRKFKDASSSSLSKLKVLWQNTGSSVIYDYYCLMNISYLEICGNYKGIIEAIEEAESLLANGKINPIWFNHWFNSFIKVYAYLRLGMLDEGLSYSKLHLTDFKEGAANWFAFLENYIMLALHKNNNDLVVQLCKLAVEKGAFENPILGARERWGILIRYAKLILSKNEAFSLLPIYPEGYITTIISKDKEGLNLPLVILEYLENLPKLDTEDMEQYIARFSKYSSKYLKGQVWERARLFIKLLLLSMKEEGDKLEEKGAALLKQLKNTPPPRDPVAEVEIVPYEHLWELVLELHSKRSQR